MRREKVLLLVSLVLLTACASSPEPNEKQLARARAALAVKGDPDSLAAAALMNLGRDSGESMELMRRAVAAAPDRPDLAWLNAQICLKWDQCDPDASERRLRELDPENGAAWWGALARAESRGDEPARDAALRAIGRSTRVDIYWTTLIARLTPPVAQTGAVSLAQAEVEVIGLLAALPLPAYPITSRSCKGEQLERPGVLEACRGVAKAFEAGDTYLTQMIGVAIAKRVWPEQSPEWEAATEARRIYEYRAKLFGKIESNPWDENAAKKYIALCAQNHREEDLFRAELIAAGENPDPPQE